MKGHGTKIIKLVSTSGQNTTEQASEGRIGKICYVDDSRTSAYVTKKILKEYGYEVDFFTSAEPAVVAILEKDYDLLLTDLTLSTGGMDGDELVRFLRNSGHPRKKLLPVIVITGTSNKETLLKIYEAGANGVLVKPITGEELHDRIRTLVPEKAFPGTADGYALEIPQALSHPGKPQTTEVPVNPPEEETIAFEEETIASEEEITHPEAEIDEAAIDDKQDSLLSTLGIPTDDKKSEPAPPVIKKSNKKNKPDSQKPEMLLPQDIANKQKAKKLSILENLKSAATEENIDLSIDSELDDEFNISFPDIKPEPANVSRQHTKPAYKSAAHQNTKPVEAGKPSKPKSAGAEFIAELRAKAKAEAETETEVEAAAEFKKRRKKTKPEAEVQQDDTDIPVLEPANSEELLFVNNTEDGIPELILEDPSQNQPEVLFGENQDQNQEQSAELFGEIQDQEQPEGLFGESQDQEQPEVLFGESQDQEQPEVLFGESQDQGQPEGLFGEAQDQGQSEGLFVDTNGSGTPELKFASAEQVEVEAESSPAFNFDTEEATGDKKIITALDINTEFADFDDDDMYSSSLSGSIFDTFKNYKILGLAALVSFGIIIWSLWNYFNVGQVHPVDTVRVSMGTLHQTINVPGKIVSKLNIEISSSSSGQIVAVKVKEGQNVKKGQTLVKLENEEAISDLKRAEGNLLSTREETALASKTLKRMRRALKLGAISRQQMEEAEASFKSAKAKEIVALEASRTAKLALNKLSVAAPFNGTVTSRFAQIGQWITPSDTLFTLVDLGQREIEVKVDSADSNAISVGQSAFMSSDAFPGQNWTENVKRIATAASRGAGTNTVSVFINLGGRAPSLRMGQQVDAEIRTFSRNNTNKLPISAIISRNGKSWAGTIREGRIHYVPIETGMEDLTHVEILQGLKTGQEVIIPRGQDLQEGDRVRISAIHTTE